MRKFPTLSWSFSKLGLYHIILRQIAILWLFVSWNISVQGLTSNRFNKNDFKYDNMSTVVSKESVESSLKIIHDIANENIGTLCVTKSYSSLKIQLNTERYDGARQKADLAAVVLQDVGFVRHGGLLDALAKGLLSDPHVISARILATNLSTGILSTSIWWAKQIGTLNEPIRVEDEGVTVGSKPSKDYPWFEDAITSPGLRSPKFSASPPNVSFKGWWTFPYYSCNQGKWLLSYSVAIAPQKHHELRGFLSIDVDVSELYINQCDINNNFYNDILYSQSWSSKIPFNRLSQNDHEQQQYFNQQMLPLPQQQQHPLGLNNEIEVFHGSHKCHQHSMDCEFRPQYATGLKTVVNGWTRGSYQCMCKAGFYSSRHPDGFNGTIMEVAYMEFQDNSSSYYIDSLICLPCAPGCAYCIDNSPCLASYNWPFRIALLTTSILCVFFTLGLSIYLFHNRKVKVFKVASPIFLTITLLGCAIMYLEMAAIFPILDTYACIATKWTRHMGFCITYTALLMKTWRVSLTYRVKSAHKVKLTDQQLLQWMIPVLLVMIIYLGTWTVSAPPYADNIKDIKGLLFKQCSYNWWDHSLAIGEVLFLLWGIRVCYNVRNAESMYNESKMISYAIYNIAFVNTLMVAIHLIIFPEAGPDIKYLLGFVRTQLSTSVTIALVFGPKIIRVLRGQGDQWDQRARVRGITASFPINGIGLVKEEPIDPYQENEELKEEIQKLAAQIEFMKIVNMEVNNRHLRPKAGGYFTLQSPMGKSLKYSHKKQLQALCNTSRSSDTSKQENSGIVEDGHSGSNISNSGGVGKESISNSATNSSLPTQKNSQEKESSTKSEKSKPEKSKAEKSNGTEKV